jgi:hypothetical protein
MVEPTIMVGPIIGIVVGSLVALIYLGLLLIGLIVKGNPSLGREESEE